MIKSHGSPRIHHCWIILYNAIMFHHYRFRILEFEHGLHIRKGLLHLSIHTPNKIQRNRQLKQQSIHQYQIPHTCLSRQYLLTRQIHDSRQSCTKYRILSKIQQTQTGLSLQCSLLIPRQTLCISIHFMPFIIKIFHSFIIQQRIHNLPTRLILQSIHISTKLCPPLGNPHRKCRISPNRPNHYTTVHSSKLIRHQTRHNSHFDKGRYDIEHHGIQHKTN
mmetsp:Transcript_14592/g.27434  ORF Transcript_14592/g.27434 Transcript_14592/m.27434 type:complete len:220 (+) Transcript_14592:812-1471(+)